MTGAKKRQVLNTSFDSSSYRPMTSTVHRLVGCLAALGLLLLAGCDSLDAPEDRAFEGTVWRLQAFLAEDAFPTQSEGAVCTRGGVTCVDDGRTYTVAFRSNGSVTARADCNTCGGSYTRSGSVLDVEGLVCTEIACGSPSRGIAFEAAIADARRFSIRGSQMVLAYGDGRGLLLRATSARPPASPRSR
jgi:heat shock protein HslJ